MTQPLRFRSAATPAAAQMMRGRLRDWLEQAGADSDMRFDLVTACSEAFNNAVQHPICPSLAAVDVDGDLVGNKVVLSIRDYGHWNQHASRAGAHDGYPIMRAFTDSVEVEYSGEGTVVTLRRALGHRGEHALPSARTAVEARSAAAPAPPRHGDDRSLLVAVIEASATIVTGTTDSFACELQRALAAGAEGLIVDLSRAQEVSTAAMNVLLDARQRLLSRGGSIAVVLAGRLHHHFRALGLHRRFLLAHDRHEALQLLEPAQPATNSNSYRRAA